MAEKNNAICSICGKGYYKCISCRDMIKLNPWKIHTDTAECYKIYQVIHGFNTGVYTKKEAKSKLQTIDLSDFNNLRDNIKNIINKIKSEDNEAIKPSVEVEAANLSNENINDILEKDINNESVVVKTRTARKRKSFEVTEETSSDIVETE